ncbi:hypothetical protein RHECNPAF_3500021 [Rhizobium etli CNPAF512]|nr:hypothetical protein RHECNPAF_3500021 [Rhizobium etli CNPAF512]
MGLTSGIIAFTPLPGFSARCRLPAPQTAEQLRQRVSDWRENARSCRPRPSAGTA